MNKITDMPPIEWCDYWKQGNVTYLADERSCDEYTRQDLAEASVFIRQLIEENTRMREALEKITTIRWGWDGDCGADQIAENAIPDHQYYVKQRES